MSITLSTDDVSTIFDILTKSIDSKYEKMLKDMKETNDEEQETIDEPKKVKKLMI